MLKRGASVRLRDAQGWTALFWAVRHCKNLESVKLLMDAGADVNARDDQGQSILFAMLPQPPNMAFGDEQCSPEVFALLRRNGVEIDQRASDGQTALYRAIRLRARHMVTMLLEAGADVNYVNGKDGASPLHAAARAGDVALVRTLLAAGADPNRRTSDGYSTSPMRVTGVPEVIAAIKAAGGHDD